MLWAYATFDYRHAPLLDALAIHVVNKIGDFNSQELVNTAWAFATLVLFDLPVLNAIAGYAVQNATKFNPQDVASLVWAFSSINFRPITLMNALAEIAVNDMAEFRPQDIANTAWSFANSALLNEPLFEAISAASLQRITSFQPQDLGNTIWAYAKLEVNLSRPLLDAIADEALRQISELRPQNLAMTAWSFATFGIVHQPLLEAISCKAIDLLSEFATHDLANLLWAYPSLELCIAEPLFFQAQGTLVDRLPGEVAQILQQVRTSHLTAQIMTVVRGFTSSLLELVWAYSFMDLDAALLEHVRGSLQHALLTVARALDESCATEGGLLSAEAPPSSFGASWNGFELPTVVLNMPDIVVLLKPPLWEVDARPPEELQESSGIDAGVPLISSFLRKTFPKETFPLLHSQAQQFGIIHRLDVPSSGLILAGKNFVGYYTLRLQQDTYELGRHYLVLCHGRMPFALEVINAKIKTTKTPPATSFISEDGKPAWTQVEPLCFVRRQQEILSLAVVIIRTGRTHQIRVHTKHIGHPTVTDGKYTDAATYTSDSSWCPRNFLHRFRLTFRDPVGSLHVAQAPLPDDLCQVLKELDPIDESSLAMQQQLLEKWVPDY
eukprot:TRINITY_DN14932_c0_g1_i1.p1 TRINITY_DN14932_c0_g1~~TRINITY_DN14932_c0_g1_i1.p1  ORF type:complete len:610 (-),score=81.99 TRINITY_DN14932_c0_g1_i1:68-1897(-)